MKKVFAIAAALMMLATTANAQSFGAGYVNSTRTLTIDAPANGFYVGFGYSAEILPGLSLNPGLYYEFLTNTSKAGGDILPGISASAKAKATEHYVNVPLHLSYGLNLSPAVKVFVYGGPTANVGIASSTKSTASGSIDFIDGASASKTKTYNNYENENFSRFDILLGAGAGIEVLKQFRVTAGYDWGMLDRHASEDVTLKRNRFAVGAAFLF